MLCCWCEMTISLALYMENSKCHGIDNVYLKNNYSQLGKPKCSCPWQNPFKCISYWISTWMEELDRMQNFWCLAAHDEQTWTNHKSRREGKIISSTYHVWENGQEVRPWLHTCLILESWTWLKTTKEYSVKIWLISRIPLQASQKQIFAIDNKQQRASKRGIPFEIFQMKGNQIEKGDKKKIKKGNWIVHKMQQQK